MKQSTKLTRNQRMYVENNRLNTYDWEFIMDVKPNHMQIKSKTTGEVKIIEKLTRKIKSA
jgi:hypothetical protein